jgi:light-regulated signal transduction histidine kinase (bacteriophytochrome)
LLTHTIAANEALQRANKDLEQFAYAASHDLQEPLRMIAIYSELLERRHSENLGAGGKELLGTIREGAHRINDLVRDLLSYTRVDGVDQLEPESADPGDVLHDVNLVLMDRIRSADATIKIDKLLPVRVHRAHLVQLLQNLLSNSLKYRSPDRKPVIHVSSTVNAIGMVELLVKDNGIGIDPAYHERIFGVFKRLHSRNVPGTGIGLAICKKIVEFYGGNVWVESVLDAGSTFHVTLPAGVPVSGPMSGDDTQSAERRSGQVDTPPGNDGGRAQLGLVSRGKVRPSDAEPRMMPTAAA